MEPNSSILDGSWRFHNFIHKVIEKMQIQIEANVQANIFE